MRSKAARAIAACKTQYETGDAAAGGQLARVLAETKAPTAEVRAIAERIGDRPGGAEAWSALGELLRTEDPEGAIRAFTRALDHRASGDRNGRLRDAHGLLRLHRRRAELGAALRYAAISYAESRAEPDRQLRARVLLNMASLLYDIGVTPATQDLLAEAEPLLDSAGPLRAGARQLSGMVHMAHGRLKLARRDLEQAVQYWKQAGSIENEHTAKHILVQIEIEEGAYDAAARTLATEVLTASSSREHRSRHASSQALLAVSRGDHARAIVLATAALATDDGSWTATLEGIRGRAYLDGQQWVEAETSLLAAIDRVERDRSDVALDALKPWVVQKEWRRPFEDLFRLYAARGRARDAYAIVQRATGRSMLDGLASSVGSEGGTNGALVRAGERLEGARSFAKSVRVSAAVKPPPIDELLAVLGDRHVITYFEAGDELWMIVARGTAPLQISRLGASAQLWKLADAVLEKPDDASRSAALASQIVPSAALPPTGTPIYIATDHPLMRGIAFAALRVDGDFLIKRNPLSLVPTAAVLAQLVSRPRAVARRTLVLGDPRNDLPGARREAEAVAAMLGTEAMIGAAATRSVATGAAGLQLLHVAAHARLTGRGPALLLADGELTAGQIVDHGISAEVVVLTSCASSDALDPDELGPLAAAFLAAGSRAVVASRWSVEDKLAAEFSRQFYAADGSTDPIRATAAAQLQLIAAGAPVSSWATFVVLGEGAATTRRGVP